MDRIGDLDLASQDVLIDVVRELEKQLWMLRARPCSADSSGDNKRWSLYGAPWLQPVATGRKSRGRGIRENKPKLLRRVATDCRFQRMVRRGSTVRVRQRASRKCLQIRRLSCPGRKRLSRAGTRGHSLMFPRYVQRQTGFGLFRRIRSAGDPLNTEQAEFDDEFNRRVRRARRRRPHGVKPR
jgi:hypothetical protein